MMWIVGFAAYLLGVATIVRFFQFVSDTDRAIGDSWGPDGDVARLREGVRRFRSQSLKGAKRRMASVKVRTPQRA